MYETVMQTQPVYTGSVNTAASANNRTLLTNAIDSMEYAIGELYDILQSRGFIKDNYDEKAKGESPKAVAASGYERFMQSSADRILNLTAGVRNITARVADE